MSHLKKPELPRRLLQLIIAAAVAAAAAPASCSQLGYCPTNCTRPGATETDGLTLLDDRAELVASVGRAVKIARTFPGVTSDDALVVHVSFQYICCVTTDEIVGKVFPALDAVKWAPVNVSFSKPVTNDANALFAEAVTASAATMTKTSAVPSPASIEPPVPRAETLKVTWSLPSPKVLALV